jgi:tetratricopeptide (TPR) repeat protein
MSSRVRIATGAIALVLALALAIGATTGNARPAASPPLTSSRQDVEAASPTPRAGATTAKPLSKTEAVIATMQARLKANPNDVVAYGTLGEAYLQRTRETGDPSYYGKAQAVFESALQRDPNNLEALIGEGSLALSRHEFQLALELGQRALTENGTVARIFGIIGDAQVELGMYDSAVATIQRMVDLRPDLSSYSRVSHLRELYGDLDGAIAAMQTAAQEGGPVSENTEYVRVQLGYLYWTKGDLAAAERTLTESLTRLPDYIQALGGLARVRVSQGRLADAIELYRRAVAQIPLPDLVIGLGEALEASGQTAEANRQYDLVRAIEQLFAANGVATDLELALFEADHGTDPAAALALARSAYGHRPNIRAADALAWALFKAGDVRNAVRYSAEALRLGTKDPILLYHAGMIERGAGNLRVARQRLTECLALNPEFNPLAAPIAQRTLAALGGPIS